MIYVKAITAIFKGFGYCLFNNSVRRLAIWPWLIGLFCYILSLGGAIYLHPLLLQFLIGEPSGFWRTVLYYLVWLLSAALLLVVAGLITVMLVMVFASVFQTAIAANVLKELGRKTPPEIPGFKGLMKETIRTVRVETFKLLWLLPVFAVVLIAGLIPVFAPIALLLGAWLLAYQFLDVVLDLYKLNTRARIMFAVRNLPLVTCFGLSLTVCWAIPLVGVLLAPVAVAAAAWLLSETKLLDLVEQRQLVKTNESN
jgi:uncharacterized protein involved in cysteine biosynthesis